MTARVTGPAAEEWRPVVGYEGTHEVSDLGRVRVLARRDARGWRRKAAMLRPWPRSEGRYLCVTLCVNAVAVKRYVHDLVLEAFEGPRPEGNEGRHLDGCNTNNARTNLAWGTPAQNAQDKLRSGTYYRPLPPVCGRGHRYPDVPYRKPSGERRCRICHTEDEAARRNRGTAA